MGRWLVDHASTLDEHLLQREIDNKARPIEHLHISYTYIHISEPVDRPTVERCLAEHLYTRSMAVLRGRPTRVSSDVTRIIKRQLEGDQAG
mmetsp:Transcript_15431/g.25505  ORF Transcript_15431/g.25505 Transcript_15431/m.25505 type:complete len:91 (-) Transcript_15431:781-1053(-)